MHSVIRTLTFLNDARAAGLSEDDQQLIVVAISENPMLGDLYQFALLATHVRRCRGFVTPIQALDSTRIYNAIIPAQRWAP